MSFKKNWKLLTGLLTATGVCVALGVCAIAGVFATNSTQNGTKTLGDGTAIEETILPQDTNVTLTVVTDIGQGKMKTHYYVPSGSTITIDGNTLSVAGRTITAEPQGDYLFYGWLDSDCNAFASGTAITVNTTVTASFAQINIEDLENTLDTMDGKIDQNTEDIGDLDDRTTQNESDIDDLQDKYDDLDATVKDIVGEVDITNLLNQSIGYLNNSTVQYWNRGSWGIIYFSCAENTKYKITKTSGNYFNVCYITENPAEEVTTYSFTNCSGATTVEFTTGTDAKYVLIQATDDCNQSESIKSTMTVICCEDVIGNLKTDVTEVSELVNNIAEKKEYVSSNILHVTPEFTLGYVNDDDGVAYSNYTTTFEYTQKIAVEAGDRVTTSNNASFRWIAAFNDGVHVLSASVDSPSEKYYVVPDGVDSLQFTVYISSNVTDFLIYRTTSTTAYTLKVTPLGYMQASGDLSAGETMQLPSHNVKNNNIFTFSAHITSFSSLKIGKQSDAYITIDSTSVVVTTYGTTLKTYTHGLTIGSDIQILLENGTARKLSLIRIVSGGEVYSITDNTSFPLDSGAPYVTSIDSELTDCVFSWTSRNINKSIWLFGDSYFSWDWGETSWAYYLAQDGFTDSCLLNGYAGEGSAAAYTSLCNLLAITTPKMVVWCMGMNDGDTNGAVNTNWKTYYDAVVSLSIRYGFELVLYTVPTTPTIDNTYKNAIIRASGFRYVDIDGYVRVADSTDWYTNMLASDNVHPTAKGARMIYYKFLTDLPELCINE